MAQRFYDPANGFSLYTGAAPTWREAQDPAGYVRGPDGSWGNYDYFTGQFTPVDPMANVQGAPAGWYGANDARLFTDSEVFQPQKATYAGDLTNTNAMLGSLKTQYGLDNVDLKSALDAYFSKTGGNINDVNWWGKDDCVGSRIRLDEAVFDHSFRGEVSRCFPFLINTGFFIYRVVRLQKLLWDRGVGFHRANNTIL